MPGYTKDKRKILTRFRRIEGQVRGVQKMVEEDRYCIDVLTQVNATRAALESVALQLLADHTEYCVAEAIRSGGGTRKVRELNEAVERAPVGELIDIMDVGCACAYLATPFAHRITGGTAYVDGGANIIA